MRWIWDLCFANMKQRGIRTGLTVLGVVIGVISIVSLLAIGLGVKTELLDLAGVEGSITEIRVTGMMGGNRKDKMLTDRTLLEIEKVEGVKAIYPVLEVNSILYYEGYAGYWEIQGVPQEYLQGIEVKNETQPEENTRRPDLVLGNQVGFFFYNEATGLRYNEIHEDEELDWTGKRLDVTFGFQENSPQGKLKVANMTKENSYYIYCDINVLKQYLKFLANGSSIPGQPTNQNGENYKEWIYSSAIVEAEDVESVDAVVKRLQDMGYQAESNKEFVDYVQRVVQIIQLVLGGIGMIALIVAVIGIGNTMTTAVYERVHEIGLLKVLGCDPEELLYLFLLESGILGGLGGLIGLLLSYGITEFLVNGLAVKLMKLPKDTVLAVIPAWLAVTAVVFAILLGILAGFFPARWAAKQTPIKAIQN